MKIVYALLISLLLTGCAKSYKLDIQRLSENQQLIVDRYNELTKKHNNLVNTLREKEILEK